MKLWLDDQFKPKNKEQYVWVKTVDEAIIFLEEGNVEVVNLDYDLKTEQTGLDVLLWIEKQLIQSECSLNVPSTIIIHSKSPSYAHKMLLAAEKIKQLCTAIHYTVEILQED